MKKPSKSTVWRAAVAALALCFVGSHVATAQDGVTPGTEVTVSGMCGSPNDQEWEIYASGDCGGTLVGESVFHISRSDDNMNGNEDCGKNLGDGKSDDVTKVNDWVFEGMSGNLTLDCTP